MKNFIEEYSKRKDELLIVKSFLESAGFKVTLCTEKLLVRNPREFLNGLEFPPLLYAYYIDDGSLEGFSFKILMEGYIIFPNAYVDPSKDLLKEFLPNVKINDVLKVLLKSKEEITH